MCQIVKNKNSRQVKPWKYKKGTQNNFNPQSCVNNLKIFISISSITIDGRLTVKMEKKKTFNLMETKKMLIFDSFLKRNKSF